MKGSVNTLAIEPQTLDSEQLRIEFDVVVTNNEDVLPYTLIIEGTRTGHSQPKVTKVTVFDKTAQLEYSMDDLHLRGDWSPPKKTSHLDPASKVRLATVFDLEAFLRTYRLPSTDSDLNTLWEDACDLMVLFMIN